MFSHLRSGLTYVVFATIAVSFALLVSASPPTALMVFAHAWQADEPHDPVTVPSQPNEQFEHFMKRVNDKERLIDALIEGRASLAETARHFQNLNQDRLEIWNAICSTTPGRTDDEKAARNVIAFALSRFEGNDAVSEGYRAWLLCELEAYTLQRDAQSVPTRVLVRGGSE